MRTKIVSAFPVNGCEKITMVLDNLEDELNHLNRVEVLDDNSEDVF